MADQEKVQKMQEMILAEGVMGIRSALAQMIRVAEYEHELADGVWLVDLLSVIKSLQEARDKLNTYTAEYHPDVWNYIGEWETTDFIEEREITFEEDFPF